MSRLRPVHRLSAREAQLAAAIAPADEPAALKQARRWKEKIEAFWAERGRSIEVEIKPISLPNGGNQRTRDYVLVSNTLNGEPVA